MFILEGTAREDASPRVNATIQSQRFFLPFMVRPQSSAAGVLALLQEPKEPDSIFKQHALKALNPLVPQFWAEISEHIALM
jgi:hypothetical protein